jgi:hypothetical protein
MNTQHTLQVGKTLVSVDKANNLLSWKSGASINADGGVNPATYRPDNTGADDLKNARDGRGGWCGVVVVNGKPFRAADGSYVSTTAYQRAEFTVCDPRRYLDANRVPFITVTKAMQDAVPGTVMGCRVILRYQPRGKPLVTCVAMVGDEAIGHAGEISVAAARALGIPSNPKSGGVDDGISFEVHAGVEVTLGDETFPLQPE